MPEFIVEIKVVLLVGALALSAFDVVSNRLKAGPTTWAVLLIAIALLLAG